MGCLEHRFCPERVKHHQLMFIKDALVTKKVVRHNEILHDRCIFTGKDSDDEENEEKVQLTTEIKDVNVDLENDNGSTITNNEHDAHHCSICLESFKYDDSVSWSRHLILCKHVYHTSCISAWLMGMNDDCPCCRRNYFPPRKESGMDWFSSTKDNDRNDEADEHANVVKFLSEAQFCVDHGLCLDPAVLAVETNARSVEASDGKGHDSDIDL